MLFFLFLLNSNKFINNIRPRKVEDTRSGIFAMLAHWLTNEIILKMKINIIWGDDATPVGHSANWNYSQHNPNMWFPESVWCNPTISIHVFFFFILNQRFHLIVLRIHAKSLLHFVIFQQHFISHSRCITSIHIIFKLYVLYIFIIRIASNFAAYIISLFQFWKWNRRDCNLVHGVTK